MIGMPSCVTTCGRVEVPYPFGIGPDSSCYLNQPGFNLTCDHSNNPPRLLLLPGEDQRLQVKYIDDVVSIVEVVRKVDISTSGSDDISLRGPFRLAGANELVLIGCNVWSTLLRRSTKKGNATAIVSICFSFCSAITKGPRFSQGRYSPGGHCIDPIIVDEHDEAAATVHYGVELSWIGGNKSADRAQVPARTFVAKYSRFDYWLYNYSISPVATTTLDPPVYLHNEISGSCSNNICKSDHSVCNNISADSCACSCDSNYTGNPYLPGGCQG
ncbi:unnamed protein product [Triticum turgidum subsp. durum]|uniref:Wall-associated receptor kinase galacturonan-binding domain-containing protein n=1 Tax=Triticum turgidum subsp. durum TaxID=4567 RepID=A0A9R1C6U1_TRITD|nr:unnamed protein product [Triticum turgidum subsp. durum]